MTATGRGPGALHELERPAGTEPVSRANQAAAFARMSRSCWSLWISLRSRLSSSRSASATGAR